MIETIEISGAEELMRALELLPLEVDRSIVRTALKAAAQPILDDARKLCPVYSGPPKARIQPGKLKESIRLKAARHGPGETAYQIVTGEGDFIGEQFYGPMVEFGHGIGRRTSWPKKGRKAGADNRPRVPPHPFLRPAFDANKQAAAQIFAQAVRTGVALVWDANVA